MGDAVIGIDLGGTKVLAGRLGADGRIEDRREVATDRSSSEAIVAQLAALVAALADSRVTGVGIGLPGTIEQTTGTLVQAVNLPLVDAPIRDRIRAATGLPVEVDNDANCAALAEHVHGAARDVGDSIMLTLGTGVGGGVVIGGALFRGSSGAGAELGHIVIEQDGLPCQGSCPGRGHLESYCSGTALGRAARAHAASLPNGSLARAATARRRSLDARLVLELAAAADEEALGLVAALGRSLGAGLVSLANAFEPEMFVIGGGFGEAGGERILEPARLVLRGGALHPMCETPVAPAVLGSDAGMIGAAQLALVSAAAPRKPPA